MKKKQKIVTIALLIIGLIVASGVYVLSQSKDRCNTKGRRPDNCVPANNRCTPPGDPREEGINCGKAEYYEPGLR